MKKYRQIYVFFLQVSLFHLNSGYLTNPFQNLNQESELFVGHKEVVWETHLRILLKE